MSKNVLDQEQVPLCVDLDGTLIKTDSLHESFLLLIKQNPLYCIIAVFWLLKSKAHFKAEVAKRTHLSVETLPYNDDVIEYIQSQRSIRKVLLVTGSNTSIAASVGYHIKLFDEVIASDSNLNLTGDNKRQYLVNRFGEGGFEYIGNDHADMPVWSSAGQVSVVSRDNSFLKKVRQTFSLEKEFQLPTPSIRDYFKAIRVHQWIKNSLIFIPFFLNQRFNDFDAVIQLLLGFLCLSLLASFTYIINDLLDLESDRSNQYKRSRAFASCLIPVKHAVIMMVALFFLVIALVSQLPGLFVIVLLAYLVTTLSYSFFFKSIAVLDVVILAGLFTLRVISGAVVIESEWSFWLLAFSMFFFLSLAYVKRFSELDNLRREGRTKTLGRGYRIEDIPMLKSSGIASGYISILIVALYINSDKVGQMYAHPEILWLLCPLLLYWIGRIWLITGRGEMHEDPIVFALRDRSSIKVALLCGVILLSAVMVSWN